MLAIRMLTDADGSPNGHTVYTYTAGEVYHADSTPPADDFLMASFVASGRAVEVDAAGNPVGTPAERRATKDAAAPEDAPVVEPVTEPSTDAPADAAVADESTPRRRRA